MATAVLSAVKEISRLPEGREALKSAGEPYVGCIHLQSTKGIASTLYLYMQMPAWSCRIDSSVLSMIHTDKQVQLELVCLMQALLLC